MKHRKEKSPRIGSAVIRGQRERYEFEVFPLDVEMQPVPAVYVISRRVIDREGRGHHKFVCIGQTESLAVELKKQKKGKCIRKFKANVISVLPTENENARFSIEADLKATHSIPCLHEPENASQIVVMPAKKLKVEQKNEKRSPILISPVVAKAVPLKPPGLKSGKKENKAEKKIEAPKPRVAKVKPIEQAELKPVKVLMEKATPKTKASLPPKAEKIKIPKTTLANSAKSERQPAKRAEPVKKPKNSASKTPVLKTKDAPKDKVNVSRIKAAPAKLKADAGKKSTAIQKPKTNVPKQAVKKAAAKTVKASGTKKTASKNELKTTESARKTVAAAITQNTAAAKKKAESPDIKGKTKQKPIAPRKRLAI